MALNLSRVMKVVSKASTAYTKVDSATSGSVSAGISAALKSSGFKFSDATSLLKSTTGVDISKYLSIGSITSLLGLDLDLSNLSLGNLSLDNFSLDSLSLDSITNSLGNIDVKSFLNADIFNSYGLDSSGLSDSISNIIGSIDTSSFTSSIQDSLGSVLNNVSLDNLDLASMLNLSIF